MALWGTIVNAAAIIVGALLGSLLPRIPDGMRRTVMQGIGLAVIVLGMNMAFQTESIILVIGSLALGGVTGELLKIEHRLNQLGAQLEKLVNRIFKSSRRQGNISEGFITATLVYCIGAMAILGAIDSGLRGNHDILYTKSMLDGISSIIFTSALGIGVIFSAIPVFLYEALIALSANLINSLVSSEQMNAIITEVTAVGGVMIVGIGLTTMEIKKINVANLLPSLLYAVIFALLTMN